MDSNRSFKRGEEGSYSEDFDNDLDSPDSRFSDEKVPVKIYKSAVGALTVKPKKSSKTMSKRQDDLSDDYGVNDRNPSPTSSRTGNMEGTKNPPGSANEPVMNKRDHSESNVNRLATTSISRAKVVNNGRNPTTPIFRRAPHLSQAKVDPRDIPPTVAASVSSLSISRLSIRNRTASGFQRTGTNNIRRVVAHTSIKEKSYASAKFKTYQSPAMLRVGPPLKTGIARQTNAAQRVASAKRMTVMDLKSKIKILQDEIESLKKENRFLNRMHHRQDHELKKWEGKDAELPRILNQHKDEIRSLQEQLRRAQQHARDHHEKLAVRDKKIFRLETELDKLKALVHEEHLQDRHTLAHDLDVTKMNLSGAEKRIREYMRHVEILEKNHRHQLAAQERKYIKNNTHLYELQQQVAHLNLALRNKDRMLNYIQMRASGRTLIRAFHAEKTEKNEPTEIINSLHSHSMVVAKPTCYGGDSPCLTPRVDVQRDYEIFSKRNQKPAMANSLDEEKRRHRAVSADSRHSETAESLVCSQTSSRKGKAKSLQKTRSLGLTGDKKNLKSQSLSDSKVKGRHEEGPSRIPVKKPLPFSARKEIKLSDIAALRNNDKLASGDTNVQPYQNYEKNYQVEESTHDKHDSPRILEAKSTEFVYVGATKGVKYEGPFVNFGVDPTTKTSHSTQNSTEILYSPKSEKALSERSMSSVCSSPAGISSRSEEIISNIDILSARIRESCVLVAPVEESFKSPRDKRAASKIQALSSGRSNKASSRQKQSSENNVLNKPLVSSRTSCDTSNPSMCHDNSMSSICDLVRTTKTVSGNNSSPSPSPHIVPGSQTTGSQKILQSTSLASPSYQTQQYQFSPNLESSRYVPTQMPTSSITVVTAGTTPLMENPGITYSSPRLHSYNPPALNVVPSQFCVDASQSPGVSARLPSDYSYYGITQPQNVAVFQAYSPMQSPHTAKTTHGSLYSSPTTRASFTRLGSVSSSTNDQSLPTVNPTSNNTNTKTNPYNPSYYINLGTWK